MSDTTQQEPAETPNDLAREERIRQLAIERYAMGDTDIDIDSDASISDGDDNGAYVAAWVWVDFGGIEGLDKEGSKSSNVPD